MSTTTGATKKATISKILVAIDGSDASMDAADYAISISKKYNAELYALHVIRADVDLFGQHETSEFMTRMRSEGEKYLDKVKFIVAGRILTKPTLHSKIQSLWVL